MEAQQVGRARRSVVVFNTSADRSQEDGQLAFPDDAPEESQFALKKRSTEVVTPRSVYKRASVVGSRKLSGSVLGGSFFKKERRATRDSLSASVAQVQVVQKLEENIEHEVDFLKMFKEGLDYDDGNDEDEFGLGDQAPMRSTGAGANFLRQLLNKPLEFDIEVETKAGAFIYSHPYLHDDIVFSLREANPNPNGAEIQETRCNCCEYEYKGYKDIKQCEFCAKTYCIRCRTKRRAFPKSPLGQTGDICKVCDRKFFIQEILKDNREKILGLEGQLLGENGLAGQIERCHKQIAKAKRDAGKIKRVYDLDCQKIEYLIEKVRDRSNQANEQYQRRTAEVDELFEKEKQKREEIAMLDKELAELEQQGSELPAQFKYVEDHVVRTEQEYRRLELQKHDLDKQQKELDRAQAELESKKRGRAPNQGVMSEAQKGQKKSLSRLLKKNGRKLTEGGALSAARAGVTADGLPQPQSLPDEDMDGQIEMQFRHSVQTDFRERSAPAHESAPREALAPLARKDSVSLRLDTMDLTGDEDVRYPPAHEASVATNAPKHKKGKGKNGKGKPRRATKGTINKGRTTGGACCGAGADAGCSIF